MNRLILKPSSKQTLSNCLLNFNSTFSKAHRGSFFQDEPELRNQYEEDAYLREHLKLNIPEEVGLSLFMCFYNPVRFLFYSRF